MFEATVSLRVVVTFLVVHCNTKVILNLILGNFTKFIDTQFWLKLCSGVGCACLKLSVLNIYWIEKCCK